MIGQNVYRMNFSFVLYSVLFYTLFSFLGFGLTVLVSPKL